MVLAILEERLMPALVNRQFQTNRTTKLIWICNSGSIRIKSDSTMVTSPRTKTALLESVRQRRTLGKQWTFKPKPREKVGLNLFHLLMPKATSKSSLWTIITIIVSPEPMRLSSTESTCLPSFNSKFLWSLKVLEVKRQSKVAPHPEPTTSTRLL